MEGEVGLDDGIPAQRALRIDIRLTKLSLSDGDATMLIGVPDHLSPMTAVGVERATIVEDIFILN